MTQLDILVLTIVIAAFVKAHIFCVSEPTTEIFCFEHRGCLRSSSVTLIFMLAGAHLRTICVSTYLSASPRIDFVLRFCSYVSFFGNYVVAFKAGPRLRRDFLSFCELFLFTTFIYTFCVFLVII